MLFRSGSCHHEMIQQSYMSQNVNETKNPIVIRIDDVCPSMDREKFERYISEFKALGVKPLLGIIPLCRDDSINYGRMDDFWALMRQMQSDGYPIAMHGVNHVYCTQAKGLVCNRKMSEFSSLSFEEQKEKLLEGKAALENEEIYTDTFMAPGHSYDRNTLKALKAIGFEYVTDGRSAKPYVLEKIKCIPAIGPWKRHSGRGVLTICLHPSSDSDSNLKAVIDLITRNKDRVISFDLAKQIPSASYRMCRIQEKVSMLMVELVSKAIKLLRRKK